MTKEQLKHILLDNIPLLENDKLWLKEVWNFVALECTFPVYADIRKITVPQTTAAYNPRIVDKRYFINQDQVSISFLGVFVVDPYNIIFEYGRRLILEVKKQLLEDADKVEFEIKDLALSLNVDYHQLRLTFHLFSDFFSMRSASSSRTIDNKIGMEYFTVDSDSSKDFYFHFNSLEESIGNLFKTMFEEPKQMAILGMSTKLNIQTSGFIDPVRFQSLNSLSHPEYDLIKLIQLCREIEFSFVNSNYYATALLLRAAIDHIPPIFNCRTFNEVTNNYTATGNERSFKKAMQHLNESLRSVGDSSIHSQVRKKEILPTATQVNFSQDFDTLLSEIVRILK
ncbi:MAG: hypothetical protein K0R65_1736 [Crocinitomicaceae bacterium]|jgi:hypothetical protein|nr:hypothetical protein [Crocinitomicaceae bacterium]